MIKRVELLGYKKYLIYQDDNLYKFNLDSLLLAYFTNIKKSYKEILDIGSANGAISLYLTLKTTNHITAVEIQKKLYDLLVKSININNLNNQITAVNNNILNLNKNNYYDLIVCNPPYFKVSKDSNLTTNKSLLIAKHEVKLTIEDVIKKSKMLLKNKGSLNLIHRPERLTEIIILLQKNDFEVKRLMFVYSKKQTQALNVLIEAIKNGNSNSLEILEPVYIYNDDNTYTKEILKVFNYGRK